MLLADVAPRLTDTAAPVSLLPWAIALAVISGGLVLLQHRFARRPGS